MRHERDLVPAEQMDFSQPNPDFVLNKNLRQFKPRIKPFARVALAATLVLGATGSGVVTSLGGDRISKELNSTCVLPTPNPRQTISKPPIATIEGTGSVLLCGDGEPPCPSSQTCRITSFECAPGVTCMSGVCVDK